MNFNVKKKINSFIRIFSTRAGQTLDLNNNNKYTSLHFFDFSNVVIFVRVHITFIMKNKTK